MMYTLIVSPFKGCNLEIKGEYSKAEKQTYEHPGCPEIFEIDTIESCEKDITELLIWCQGRDVLAELEELCLKQVGNADND